MPNIALGTGFLHTSPPCLPVEAPRPRLAACLYHTLFGVVRRRYRTGLVGRVWLYPFLLPSHQTPKGPRGRGRPGPNVTASSSSQSRSLKGGGLPGHSGPPRSVRYIASGSETSTSTYSVSFGPLPPFRYPPTKLRRSLAGGGRTLPPAPIMRRMLGGRWPCRSSRRETRRCRVRLW